MEIFYYSEFLNVTKINDSSFRNLYSPFDHEEYLVAFCQKTSLVFWRKSMISDIVYDLLNGYNIEFALIALQKYPKKLIHSLTICNLDSSLVNIM